jgi:hypothetical protein
MHKRRRHGAVGKLPAAQERKCPAYNRHYNSSSHKTTIKIESGTKDRIDGVPVIPDPIRNLFGLPGDPESVMPNLIQHQDDGGATAWLYSVPTAIASFRISRSGDRER